MLCLDGSKVIAKKMKMKKMREEKKLNLDRKLLYHVNESSGSLIESHHRRRRQSLSFISSLFIIILKFSYLYGIYTAFEKANISSMIYRNVKNQSINQKHILIYPYEANIFYQNWEIKRRGTSIFHVKKPHNVTTCAPASFHIS